MNHSSDEDTDLSDSELDEEVEKYIEELKNGKHRMKGADGTFMCPFSQRKRKRDFNLRDQLQHAFGVGKSNSDMKSTEKKAKHLALSKYLENYLVAEGVPSKPVAEEEPPVNCDHDEKLVWPGIGVVANIPTRQENDGRVVGESGSKLRDEFNPYRGHSGSAAVEDKLVQASNEVTENKKTQVSALDLFKRIFSDHEELKLQLESQKKEIESHIEETEKRAADSEIESGKLTEETEKNSTKKSSLQSAAAEQVKANEKLLKLAEDQKREEELHNKIIKLEKDLDAKQALELQIEQPRGNLNDTSESDGFTIPTEVWQSILQFVAAESLHVVLDLRTVCKTFLKLIDDQTVYSCIDMAGICGLTENQFPEWKVRQRRFFAKQCLEANNPEALFRKAMRTMKSSGNIMMTMHYLEMSCRPGTIFRGLYRWIEYHDVAFYVLSMLQLIRGDQEIKNKTVEKLVSRLNWRNSGWDVVYCREEAHKWVDIGQPLHGDLLKHMPPNYSFLPGKCNACGEHMFHRPFLENMWFVNGDRNDADCCDVCKCYVEASNFYYKIYWASQNQHMFHSTEQEDE